jgi:hypothetical protein
VIVKPDLTHELIIRQMEPQERSLVVSSWLRCCEFDRPDMCLPSVWRKGHAAWIDRLLERTTPMVACLQKVRDEVLGWAVSEPPEVLHFVYVKRDYRGMSVCRTLLRAALYSADGSVVSTHDTRGAQHVRSVCRDLGLKLYFDPWRRTQ